ncbi:hypothetical protein GQR58_018282 [Nymphon striatum]|nr:hypothetical protein GQR58_018282 [Nymphon striatum]
MPNRAVRALTNRCPPRPADVHHWPPISLRLQTSRTKTRSRSPPRTFCGVLVSAAACVSARQIPAADGSQGPGDSTMPSGYTWAAPRGCVKARNDAKGDPIEVAAHLGRKGSGSMRGLIGGMLTGGLVSVAGLGVVSVVSEQPAGILPPDAPLVDAPMVEPVETVDTTNPDAPSTPVGSVTIDEPQAPDLPEGEGGVPEPDAPSVQEPEAEAPRADTDPLDEPEVTSVEGAMEAPQAPETANIVTEPVAPVLPNPQSLAPQTPDTEADLTVSTAPAQPTIVAEPEPEAVIVVDEPATQDVSATDNLAAQEPESDDFFVVDLGADAATTDNQATENEIDAEPEVIAQSIEDTDETEAAAQTETEAEVETEVSVDAPVDEPEDIALNTEDVAAAIVPTDEPRVQLGGANTLLNDRDTGVTIRRSGGDDDTATAEEAVPALNALEVFAAETADVGSKPLMSIVLIDDGSMSAAAAALAGLPFAVTIALDPALPDANDLMMSYRNDGFEVVVLAKLPEGAVPSDVEVTFESVFSNLPETIAVLDIGEGGLQTDRAVTEQAMDILASQGRGFITASKGLNMAGRAADQAGVPAAAVFRDLDADNQDARVVRRFVDQAAFRARQESGVVLVGRVRPDTISALILWGTANSDELVAVVPVSAVLTGR